MSGAVALTPGCGDVLYAEIEIPEVCKTFTNQQIEAAPVPAYGTIERSFDFPLDQALPELPLTDAVELDVRLSRMEVTVTDGIQDFSFAQEASVILEADPASNLQPTLLIDYDFDPAQAAQASVNFASSSTNNLVPYLTAGALKLTAKFTGQLPTVPWTVDVKACMTFKGKVDYGAILQQQM